MQTAAGLVSQAGRRTTSCGNGWLATTRRHEWVLYKAGVKREL